MKTKYMIALGLIGMGATLATPAQAGLSIGISIGVPWPAPVVVVRPPPLVACAPPVVVAPPPVRVYAPPGPVCAPPVMVMPRPIVPVYRPVVWGPPGHVRWHYHGPGHHWHH